ASSHRAYLPSFPTRRSSDLKENPTLADLQQYVRDMVAERGFNDDVQNKFMMLIEEVGEFAKASRKHAGMGYATDVQEQDLAGERSEEHTSELQSRENLACRL